MVSPSLIVNVDVDTSTSPDHVVLIGALGLFWAWTWCTATTDRSADSMMVEATRREDPRTGLSSSPGTDLKQTSELNILVSRINGLETLGAGIVVEDLTHASPRQSDAGSAIASYGPEHRRPVRHPES